MVNMKEVETAYQAALDYLYSFVDYSLTHSSQYAQAKFDLGRMVVFLDRLGNPHQHYPVIHVAGTKGKGSTAAMMASGLAAAGYRVGLYSSPHLQEYTERMQVNGRPIEKRELVELIEQVKPIVAQVELLTTFEITTALGFLHFAHQKVDAAVIEVGLGGRLDATNVVDPLVSVITSLSMDHMSVLGDTLPKIAAEKAGIIKPGRPVVLAPQREEARQVVEQVAAERNSPLVEVARDYQTRAGEHSLEGQTFQVWKNGEQPVSFSTPLLGLHQVENAATAYAALRVANDQGLRITEASIRQGFARVVWPGRFEVLRAEPAAAGAANNRDSAPPVIVDSAHNRDSAPPVIVDSAHNRDSAPPVIVDSAHNRDSAQRLAQALEDYLPGRPVVLIFGASEDKDIEGMFAELMPRVSMLIATQSTHPRAMPADRLVEIARKFGRPAEAVVPVEKALPAALKAAAAIKSAGALRSAGAIKSGGALKSGGKQTATGAPVVLAAGSLFVAAAVRDIWMKQEAIVEV